MEKMRLSEVVKAHQDYEAKKITQDEFVDSMNRIFVRDSITIREKLACVMSVLFGFDYDENDVIEKYAQLEMNKFWYIMLAYMDIDFEEDCVNEENYDLLYPTLSRAIYTYALPDFERTLELLDRIDRDSKYGELLDIFGEISNTNFSELIESDKEVIQTINNPEFVSNLVQLANFINPTNEKINKKIEKTVAENLNKTKE